MIRQQRNPSGTQRKIRITRETMHAGDKNLHRLPRIGTLKCRVGSLGVIAGLMRRDRKFGDQQQPSIMRLAIIAERRVSHRLGTKARLGRMTKIPCPRGKCERGLRIILEFAKSERGFDAGLGITRTPHGTHDFLILKSRGQSLQLLDRWLRWQFQRINFLGHALAQVMKRRGKIRLLPTLPVFGKADGFIFGKWLGPRRDRIGLALLQPCNARMRELVQHRRHVGKTP